MSLIMKTCLIGLVGVALLSASNESEDLFIKGLAYSHIGQDSLACESYKEACQKDSSSVVLKEVYARSLLKIGKVSEATLILRSAADAYVSEKKWSEAYGVYKDLYLRTQAYDDGCMIAVVLMNDGVDNYDSSKMAKAGKVWDILMNKAITKDHLDTAIQIIDLRIKTTREIISKLKVRPSLKVQPPEVWSFMPII